MTNKTISALIEAGLVKKAAADPQYIHSLIKSAEIGLQKATCGFLKDPAECFAHTYDAVFDSCRAYMLSQGFWTVAENDHRTVILFCKQLLDSTFTRILNKFGAFEQKRHKATYTGFNFISASGAQELLKAARIFIDHIKNHL